MNLQRLRKLAGLTILTEDYGDVRPVTMRIHEAMDEMIMEPRAVADAALAYMSEAEVADMAASNDWFYDEYEDEDDQEDHDMEEAIVEDSGRVYELIGLKTEHEYGYGGYTGNTTDHENVVATFGSEEAAHEYAKKSTLKRSRASGGSTVKFHSRSLLAGYEGYSVEEKIDDIAPPHNPE